MPAAAARLFDDDSSQPPFEAGSAFPKLDRPHFESAVPQHLLAGASDADCYIMNELSKINQAMSWSVEAHLASNHQTRKMDERLMDTEEEVRHIKAFKKSITGGWRFLAAAAAVVAGVVSFGIHIVKFLNGQ